MGPNSCPTVAIKVDACEGNPDGVVVINECDFDEATMTKYEEPEPDGSQQPAPTVLDPIVPPVQPVATTTVAEPTVIAPWAAK